jgi:hypothetical protein
MPYSLNHTEHNCDKCEKYIGKTKLLKLPFMYLDKNDNIHNDMSMPGMEPGYRQYYVCKKCFKEQTVNMK